MTDLLWSLYAVGFILSAGFWLGLCFIGDFFKTDNIAINLAVLLFFMIALALFSWIGAIAMIILGYNIQRQKETSGWDK